MVEGKTPEVTVKGARDLLSSIKTVAELDGPESAKPLIVGLRDRAIIGILIYTASRAGAVAKLKCGSFYDAGDQCMLHFNEKGGKSREIPVRHDLERMIREYIEAAGLRVAAKDAPLFRTTVRKEKHLTERPPPRCTPDARRIFSPNGNWLRRNRL